MSRRLVTVAVYDLPPHAHMARQALEAAGIKATVADDQMVGMDWLLTTAVGGVKVQVWEEDAERAAAVLEDAWAGKEESGEPPADEPGGEYEPTEADFAPEPPEEVPAAELETGAEARDRFARRALFTGIVGLLFCPASFYALYLCLNASFGPGPLTRRGRFELILAWAFLPLGGLLPGTVFYR